MGNTEPQQAPAERRYAPRKDVFEYAEISVGDASIRVKSVAVNVSLGGIRLISKEEFAPGLVCRLTICQRSGDPIDIGAEVVSSSSCGEKGNLFGTGFKVDITSPADRLRWARFLNQVYRD